MFTRRLLTKAILASAALTGSARSHIFAETGPLDLEYQGPLAFSNPPELPTAPDGECSIVLEASKKYINTAVAVYHNASDEAVSINAVSATATDENGEELGELDPAATMYIPNILQPGEYGMAFAAFKRVFREDPVVATELEIGPASEADPAIVNLAVSNVELGTSDSGMNQVRAVIQQTSESLIEPGATFGIIFFTPEGEIQDWITTSTPAAFEPGETMDVAAATGLLSYSESVMAGFTGRTAE